MVKQFLLVNLIGLFTLGLCHVYGEREIELIKYRTAPACVDSYEEIKRGFGINIPECQPEK